MDPVYEALLQQMNAELVAIPEWADQDHVMLQPVAASQIKQDNDKLKAAAKVSYSEYIKVALDIAKAGIKLAAL